MNDSRFSALATRLPALDLKEVATIQGVRAELIDLKLLLEQIQQRELADFLGAADSMIRSIAVLEGEAFLQVRDLVTTLVGVVAETVAGLGGRTPEASGRSGGGTDAPLAALPAGVESSLEQIVESKASSTPLSLSGETASTTHSGLRTMSELLLGQILVDSGCIERAQLVAALKMQATEHILIGEALVKLGHLEPGQLEEALETQQALVAGHTDEKHALERSKLLHELGLGEILVRVSGLAPDDLERALQVQRATGKRLGEALVELGVVTWDRVEEAARIQAKGRSANAWGPGGTTSLRLND